MKHLAIVFFLLSSPLSTHATSSDSIVFCDDPFPPVTRESEGGKIEGPSISFLQEVFRRLEIPLDIKNTPWKRVLNGLERGTCDGVNYLLDSAERREFAIYTAPIQDGVNQLIWSVSNSKKFPMANPTSFEWQTLDDFSTVDEDGARSVYSIAETRGYAQPVLVQEGIDQGKIIDYRVSHSDQRIRMLLAGRVSLIIDTRAALVEHLKTFEGADIEDFHSAKKSFEMMQYYMVISKKSKWLKKRPNLLSDINKVIETIKQEGKHTVQAYLVKEAQEQQ
ncbi:MAG: amino acid ABC transporter substrate-binding protein [Gammaproteobacteria bacterium]|nr:amino acid ABC transporter substrate-binding protein [Gammaproteobacteria bacterium]